MRKGGKRVGPPREVRKDELRILFLGNSLTYFNEMPWITEQVAASLGVAPTLRAVFSGASGMTLRQHWQRGRAVTEIREGQYAYVVLQPQSSEIIRTPGETFRYAELLDGEIRRSGAKTIVFSTWAPLEYGRTQGQYDEASRKLARELGAILAPVGTAWQALRKSGIELFDKSGVHPNLAGSYLTACVFVATVYKRSPAGAVHRFEVHFDIPEFYRQSLERESIPASTAEEIQRQAWLAVSRTVISGGASASPSSPRAPR